LRSVFVNSPPPKPEVILTNFFAEPTVLLVPITSRAFDRVYQRTSKALGVSYTSVHRIMNDKRPCKSHPKKELKFWTTLIIVLLKEQSTVCIHGKLLRPSQ
jgi:hypothetical protein